MASMSAGLRPARSRQKAIACSGSSQVEKATGVLPCLRRLKRSSSAAATILPSTIRAAAGSWKTALTPRTFMPDSLSEKRFSSNSETSQVLAAVRTFTPTRAPMTRCSAMEHRIGIVVASHNRRELLLDTVARHVALPERPPVVVVDNASTDGTAAALAAGFPGIEVIRLERNAGGAGRNLGVSACETPYVALTDDDAWWQPGALRLAAEVLDANPRLALIQARVLVGPDERDDPTCLEMAASPLAAGEGQPGHPVVSFVACAVVVRRAAFLGVGGFEERLAVGGEEELVGWDLIAAGWQLSYVPEVVAHHDPPPAPARRPKRRETQVRNALWTS